LLQRTGGAPARSSRRRSKWRSPPAAARFATAERGENPCFVGPRGPARRSQSGSPVAARTGGDGTKQNRRTAMDQSKMKIVYVITKRKDRSFWNRIGVAFVNGDGSLNVKLESLPVNGDMQIRDYVPREDSVFSGGRDLHDNGHGTSSSESYSELA
jgi:hypothetical protein